MKEEDATTGGITGIACTLLDDGTWELTITKEFAPTFRYNAGPQLLHALNVARDIITEREPVGTGQSTREQDTEALNRVLRLLSDEDLANVRDQFEKTISGDQRLSPK